MKICHKANSNGKAITLGKIRLSWVKGNPAGKGEAGFGPSQGLGVEKLLPPIFFFFIACWALDKSH